MPQSGIRRQTQAIRLCRERLAIIRERHLSTSYPGQIHVSRSVSAALKRGCLTQNLGVAGVANLAILWTGPRAAGEGRGSSQDEAHSSLSNPSRVFPEGPSPAPVGCSRLAVGMVSAKRRVGVAGSKLMLRRRDARPRQRLSLSRVGEGVQLQGEALTSPLTTACASIKGANSSPLSPREGSRSVP
jgi:hypothetical protein